MLFDRKTGAIVHILIVEDEPLIAFDNEHFLLEHGYQVVATVDGVAEALAVLSSEKVDLVLADIALSGGDDGMDVARAAHARGISTLLVSGTCPEGAVPFAAGCLRKPYSQRQLKAAIEALARGLSNPAPGTLPDGMTLY